jgi:hypothetical protein
MATHQVEWRKPMIWDAIVFFVLAAGLFVVGMLFERYRKK